MRIHHPSVGQQLPYLHLKFRPVGLRHTEVLAVQNPPSRVCIDVEIVFSWLWNSLWWLEQVVELLSDLDSPLFQVCQHRFVFPEFFSYLSFPDVEHEYLVLTRLCHCSAGLFCGYQVDGCHLSYPSSPGMTVGDSSEDSGIKAHAVDGTVVAGLSQARTISLAP